jgi:hypothetical protein
LYSVQVKSSYQHHTNKTNAETPVKQLYRKKKKRTQN